MTTNPYATPGSAPEPESESPPGRLRLAGVGIRFAAFLIDVLIQTIVNLSATVLTFRAAGRSYFEEAMVPGRITWDDPDLLITMGIQIAFSFAFHVGFWATLAATPGKLICGIYIVSARTRRPVGTGQSIGRWFGYVISYITCCIGYVIAAFTDRRQALHDLIANTYVVHRK